MRSDKQRALATLIVGGFAFAVVLAYHRIVDGDLWARLAVGARVWRTGSLMRHDVFAFTPTLPEWIDHEWGAGVIFSWLLNTFGPVSLMLLKITTACAAILLCLFAARRSGTGWSTLLLLAIPCAVTVLPGYVTVIRSHALTYLFFALTLLCLEEMRTGRQWLAFVIPPLVLVWANVHGGFVVGLIAMGVYAASVRTRTMLLTLLAAATVTCINPYGVHYWTYLVPAWLHPRMDITEWGPMPFWGGDPYFGFRILFVIALVAIVGEWKQRTALGLTMLALTAIAAWLHRRHAPFFGLTVLVYLGPYAERWCRRVPLVTVLAIHVVLAIFVAIEFLPQASLQPIVPLSFYPVGAVAALDQAAVKGNLAVPFRWGSYASWRLAPRIKVSMDGRYEETYPDATFEMNQRFFHRTGTDWDRLLREYRVDFIILELRTTQLSPADLRAHGYEVIRADDTSVLLARSEFAPRLREAVTKLPPKSSDALDPHLAARWLP
ncbi:MAG TPA: hypothetical protein VNL17_09095 [Verrucomicrobiae bacterium]|nr:hypothetical protein [Verrucomicrobiae bacterium]